MPKGLSDESINPPGTSDSSFAPPLNYIGFSLRKRLDCQCLKEDQVTFNHENVVNIHGHLNRVLILC